MKYGTILEQLVPTTEEQRTLRKIVQRVLAKIKITGAQAMLGGSGAKNTWLKGTHDIDIYVKFNYTKYKDASDKLSDILHKTLKKHFKVTRLHGSRDYFHIKQNGYVFEIVPILAIPPGKPAKNITDYSYLHAQYVTKHPKLVNDIRLAKAFAQAQRVYGAESHIRGFSGYVLELLVIHYGSFNKLMKAVSTWKKKELIGSKKVFARLNASKKLSPLILIDPVQPDRNAAAALSEQQYKTFIKAAKRFVKKPTEQFFYKQTIDFSKLAKKGKLLLFDVTPTQGKHDVVGAKILKAYAYMKKQLMRHEFFIKTSGYQFAQESFIYFVFDPKMLSKTKKHYGPPLKNKQHFAIFKNKYKNIQTSKGKAVVTLPRTYRKPEELLKKLIKDEEVVTRVKKIQQRI